MASSEIDEFEKSTRRSRSIKLTILILAVLSPLIWVIYKNVSKRQEIAKHEEEYRERMRLTAADKKHMEELIASTRKQLLDMKQTFESVVTTASLDALEDAGTPCRARTNGDFKVYKHGESIDSGLPLWSVDDIEKRLREGTADKNDLDRLERLSYQESLLFVVGKQRDAIVLPNEYLPGSIEGYAYVYSHRAKKVVCFASFAVQNAPTISVEYTAMKGNFIDEENKRREAAVRELAADLMKQAREGIPARLHETL